MGEPRRTVELRWFRRNGSDQRVRDWLAHLGSGRSLHQDDRTDVYAVLPDQQALSLKCRGGSTLEVKGRRRPVLERYRPRGGSSGRVEEWLKWSMAIGQCGFQWPSVDVTKRGPRVVFDLERELGAAVTPAKTRRVASVECIAIQLPKSGAAWWSFAIEVAGDLSDADLVSAALHFSDWLMAECPVTFEDDESMSYAGWLDRAAAIAA